MIMRMHRRGEWIPFDKILIEYHRHEGSYNTVEMLVNILENASSDI